MIPFINRKNFYRIPFVSCLTLLLISCSENNQIKKTSHYSVKAEINTEKQLLNSNVSISYLPTKSTLTDSLEFIVHENAIINKCSANGLLNYVEKKKNNKAKSIVLYFNHKIEKPVNITFDYDFVLKKEDAPWGIDRISEDWIELSLNSGWLPIISSYNNQFSSVTELSVQSKNKFDILSSGTTKKLKNNKFEITNLVPQIDLVLIGSTNFDKSSNGNITIYENKSNKERNKFIHNLSEKSFQWLDNKFGHVKKLPSAKLIITPRNESGYARKNLIVLSNDISVKDTIHFVNYITHEFAHFWSNGANPLTEHRWLDESIAEYVAWKYIDKEFGNDYLKTFLNRAEKEADTISAVYIKGVTKIPAHPVMYRKGVYKLFELEKRIGEENMFLLLSNWFKIEKKNSEEFLDILENSSGNKMAQHFRLELSR